MNSNPIARYFRFEQLETGFKKETIGGITTFVTMAYVMVVNPKILEAAGIPFGPSMVATVLSAFFGTLAMGLYARRPFAIAPYMGENAFIAITVVQVMGYSWQTALGAVFIGGVIFTLISLGGIRRWLAEAIPNSLKIAFAVGIGLFLTFVGLNATGIVALGSEGAPVRVGDLTSPSISLALACFLLIGILSVRRVTGAMLIGIAAVATVAFAFDIAPLPDQIVSLPPSLGPIFLEFDLGGALQWGFLSVILTVLVTDFVDTTGTLLGLAYKSDLLDERGNLPEIEKPMLCDSVATVVAACLGTTTTGTYLESAAGIQAGGRSGFSAVVTALFMLATLFFSPILTAVPPCAYAPALWLVGLLMMAPVVKLPFDDLTETIPAFTVIILMCFTLNLGIGLTSGFIAYPLMKLLTGRGREVKPGGWVLGVLAAVFFLFYPY
jgi:AGZA family xanthine/uracil permease-like MFS transporter